MIRITENPRNTRNATYGVISSVKVHHLMRYFPRNGLDRFYNHMSLVEPLRGNRRIILGSFGSKSYPDTVLDTSIMVDNIVELHLVGSIFIADMGSQGIDCRTNDYGLRLGDKRVTIGERATKREKLGTAW
jgi:hypothetical protein